MAARRITDNQPHLSCSAGEMARVMLIATLLMIGPNCAEATGDMNVCYVLDGILVLYGIILTVLYCRLRKRPANKTPARCPERPPSGGIYTGLYSATDDTYETIRLDKKPVS